MVVDERIYEYLTNLSPERPFSTVELRDSLLNNSTHCEMGSVAARRFIHAQLVKLTKRGLLSRSPIGAKGKSGFKLCPDFFHAPIVRAPSPFLMAKGRDEVCVPVSAQGMTLVAELEEKVKKYQMELLASVGEAEEYGQILADYPELKPSLEEKYRCAREKSSKLLGQVRAVELVLREQGGKPI